MCGCCAVCGQYRGGGVLVRCRCVSACGRWSCPGVCDGGHPFQRKISVHSTRQRRRPPKIRDAPRTSAENHTMRGPSTTSRFLKTLHAPAPLPAQSHEKVVDYQKSFEDAPRTSAATHLEQREGRRCRTASIATRPKPRKGRRLRTDLRTLHAPAPPSAQNHERVVDYRQNSEDAPRASAAVRPKPRKSRRLRTEF